MRICFIEKLNDYYKDVNAKIIVINGARQIGKSFIIRETAKKYFASYVEINLKSDFDGDKIFKDVKKTRDFYLQLSAMFGNKLNNLNDTIIFLDEIQVYPHLLTMLKDLKLENNYRYIASGSLLGITLKHTLIPMGSIDEIKMYPMDFEEFLYANNVGENVVEYLRNCFNNIEPVSENIHKIMLEKFKEYLISGGLPDFVKVNGEERFASNGLNVVHKRLLGADADQYLFIELGALGESFTVNFTKIEICEIENDYDYEDTISNFIFSDNNVYANFDGEGAYGNLDIKPDETSINIEKGPSTFETWRTKLTISLGKLIVGEYYKISFDVVSSKEQGNVEVLYGQGDNEKELGEYYSQTLSTNVQTFTHVCQIKNTQDAFIRLMLGSIGNDSNKVTVTNVKVSRQIERKVENTQDISYYRPAYLNMIDDSGTLSYDRDSKIFNYNISSFGENSYSNKLEVKDVTLKKDAKYSIEFKASSNKDIIIKFLVSVQGGEWKTLVADENVELNSETNTYTYSFEVLDDDIVVDLLWEFGGEANSIVGSSNVSISDIKVLTQNYA